MSIHSLVISCGFAESQSFAQVIATYAPGAATKEEIIEKFKESVKRFLIHQMNNNKKSCCIKQSKNTKNVYCSKCGKLLGKDAFVPNEEDINEFISSLSSEDIDSFGSDNSDWFESEGWSFWQRLMLGHVVEVVSWDYPKDQIITEYWVGPLPSV